MKGGPSVGGESGGSRAWRYRGAAATRGRRDGLPPWRVAGHPAGGASRPAPQRRRRRACGSRRRAGHVRQRSAPSGRVRAGPTCAGPGPRGSPGRDVARRSSAACPVLVPLAPRSRGAAGRATAAAARRVLAVGRKPGSWAMKRHSRSARSGSSRNASSEGGRNRPALRSEQPRNGSITVPPQRSYAIALIVRSRLNRSGSRPRREASTISTIVPPRRNRHVVTPRLRNLYPRVPHRSRRSPTILAQREAATRSISPDSRPRAASRT